jgi:two-component system response regulator LytT
MREACIKIMYIIGICEGNLEYRKWAGEIICSFGKSKNLDFEIHEFTTKQELLNYYLKRPCHIDFLFFNTKFGEETTIMLAKQVKEMDAKCQIVFWTEDIHDYSQCYEVEHSYFLEEENLEEQVEHMFQCLMEKYHFIEHTKLIVSVKGKKLILEQKEIEYMERSERKTYIYMHGHERGIVISEKISELAVKLDHNSFLRCHNSYIVNVNYVTKYYRNRFELKNEKSIPISRKYYKDCQERF